MPNDVLSIMTIAEAFIGAVNRSNKEILELISASTVVTGTTVISGVTTTLFQFDLTNQANLQIFQAKISANNIINQTSTNTIASFGQATQAVAANIK